MREKRIEDWLRIARVDWERLIDTLPLESWR